MINTAIQTQHPRYLKYKDSGIDWIGEIPEGWEVKKLKYTGKIQTGNTPSREKQEFFTSENGIPWVKPDELNDFTVITTSKEQLTTKGVLEARIIAKNSILVCCIGTIGKIGIAGTDLCTNQQINSITFNELVYKKYAPYMMYSSQKEHQKLSNGNVVSILNSEKQKNIYIPIPPLAEQQQIADFLDNKTALIDEAIGLKQQQIDKLKEYKQITIQTAVTRGLNPNAPMKDSGIDWIGEIPEGWEVKKLKFLGEAIIGLTYSPENLCDRRYGIMVARSSNLDAGKFKYNTDDVYVNCRVTKKLILQDNDILICSRNGSRELIGKCAYIKKQDAGNSFGAFTTVFRSPLNYYLFHIFNSNIFKMLSGSFLTSTINQLTVKNLQNICIPIPPLAEQQQIADYLEQKSAEIDATIAHYQEQIDKLKEYKTVLIQAAVTGQIKVSQA